MGNIIKQITARNPTSKPVGPPTPGTRAQQQSGANYAAQAAAAYKAQQAKAQQEMRNANAGTSVTSNLQPGDISYLNNLQYQGQQQKNALTNQLSGQRYAGQGEAELAKALAAFGQSPTTPHTPSVGSSGGGSSGGGGGASTPAQDPMAAIAAMTGTIDPGLRAMVPTSQELDLMYNKLKGNLTTERDNLNKDYTDSTNRINQNYADSANLIQQAITGDANTLGQAAKNMGVDNWSTGPTAQGSTALLNDLTAVGSQNRATDLSWFEKMKSLDADQFMTAMNLSDASRQRASEEANSTLVELQNLANQQAQMVALQQLVAASGGGSGGGGGGGRSGRSGGGSGSSTKPTYQTLTEDTGIKGLMESLGLSDDIAALPPNLQTMAVDYLVKGGGTGLGAAQKILADMEKGGASSGAGLGVSLPGYVDPNDRNKSLYSKNPTAGISYTNTGYNSSQLNQLYNLMLGYIPSLNPTYTGTTTQGTDRKTKIYDPTPYVGTLPGPAVPAVPTHTNIPIVHNPPPKTTTPKTTTPKATGNGGKKNNKN